MQCWKCHVAHRANVRWKQKVPNQIYPTSGTSCTTNVAPKMGGHLQEGPVLSCGILTAWYVVVWHRYCVDIIHNKRKDPTPASTAQDKGAFQRPWLVGSLCLCGRFSPCMQDAHPNMDPKSEDSKYGSPIHTQPESRAFGDRSSCACMPMLVGNRFKAARSKGELVYPTFQHFGPNSLESRTMNVPTSMRASEIVTRTR